MKGQKKMSLKDEFLKIETYEEIDRVNVGGVFADSDDVGFFERFGGFHLHAAATVAVRHDDDGVRAHGGHLFLDGFFGTFAHGDHGDDGCDTNDDAEHRKEGAHTVTQQGAEGDFYESNRRHV